jgi:enediyne polyketide synthase
VELVAETRLSLRADPYLADYRIDGLPVLPPTLALEAMAQAASALAGGPLRQAGEVRLAAPVVLPWGPDGGETVIRVCALSRDDEVETVLRCAATRFQVDHARAVFRAGGSARAGHAADGLRQRRPGTGAVSPGGIVDGTDLYGPVFFQTGRFRRVAFLPETSSRDCRALVRGGDTSPWFGPVPGPVDVPLILGSPGLNDATLQVLQACLPHRRLLPAGCDRVRFMGQEVRGALQVMARQRAASDEWDVVAVDATGTPVVAWAGLRLRDVGPLARTAAWHPALLANSVEARAAELGIDATLRAVISSGRSPLAGTAPVAADAALAEPGAPPVIPALTWTDTAPGRGPLDGFELRVAAARPVACRWEAATEPPGDEALLDEGLLRLRQQLDRVAREAPAARRSRFRAVAACLAALGREPGSPCELEDARDGGWVTVRAPGVAAACTVTAIAGVPAPVCLAIASKLVPAGPQHPPPSPGAADGEAMTANGVRP